MTSAPAGTHTATAATSRPHGSTPAPTAAAVSNACATAATAAMSNACATGATATAMSDASVRPPAAPARSLRSVMPLPAA